MKLARPDVRYMHCLPSERGFQVEDEGLDGRWGIPTFDVAENLLHTQKEIMANIIPRIKFLTG